MCVFYSDVPDSITVPANSGAQIWRHLYQASVSPFEEEGRKCFEEGKDLINVVLFFSFCL